MRIRAILVGISASLLLPALFFAQQSDVPQTPGSRKDPGLFGGQQPQNKKGEDENVRAVAGIVSDPEGKPVEGAVVKLKDTKTLRIRSFITRNDGSYRFSNLSTNIDYELQADYNQMASDSRTLSVFDSRKQAVMNLKLQPAKDKK